MRVRPTGYDGHALITFWDGATLDRFTWTPDLETGNVAIDEQHRSLFALAESLRAAIEDTDDGEAVADCVWQLADYVVQHFADEQDLMLREAYPALSAHKALHDHLTAETMSITARFMNGEHLAAGDLAPLITRWLRAHISSADRAFVTYLNAGGHL